MAESDGSPVAPHRRAPRLNERILSSLSRRSMAAHPWHDLEIGLYSRRSCISLYRVLFIGDKLIALYYFFLQAVEHLKLSMLYVPLPFFQPNSWHSILHLMSVQDTVIFVYLVTIFLKFSVAHFIP